MRGRGGYVVGLAGRGVAAWRDCGTCDVVLHGHAALRGRVVLHGCIVL
jgi:hypothetical protein